jgi:hypothetical protein
MSLCVDSAQAPPSECDPDIPMPAPESDKVSSVTLDEASHKVYPTTEPHKYEPDEREDGEPSWKGPSDEELHQRKLRSGAMSVESYPPDDLVTSPPPIIIDSSPASSAHDASPSSRTSPSIPHSPGGTIVIKDHSSPPC